MSVAELAETPTRWAVVHKLRSGRQSRSIPRLLLEGVPVGVKRGEVLERLEAAGASSKFSDGGVAWANHALIPEARWPERFDAGGGRVEVWSWEQLEAAQKGRRITLQDVEPADYARITLAARLEGLSLNQWCIRQLVAAATS